MTLWLIKRGPKPDYHRAPFHPVIATDRKWVAEWEAGCSCDRATVWMRGSHRDDGEGWLLVMWDGFPIRHGYVIHACRHDEIPSGFRHPHREGEPWALLDGASWWSWKVLPEWLAARGVTLPTDEHSRLIIDEHERDRRHPIPRTVFIGAGVAGRGWKE